MIRCELWNGTEFLQAKQLFEIMGRMREVWSRLRPVGLRPSEMSTLAALARLQEMGSKPVTISNLAREMGQSLPGVSQKVSELEKQGYLKRVADGRDRRVVTVGLTEQGRKVAEEALRGYLQKIEQALASLGKEKSEELFCLMGELNQALQAACKKSEGGDAS